MRVLRQHFIYPGPDLGALHCSQYLRACSYMAVGVYLLIFFAHEATL